MRRFGLWLVLLGGCLLPELDVQSSREICQACVEAQCTTQWDTCQANQACADLVECAFACEGNTDCVIGCSTQFPNGQQDATELLTCFGSNCPTECEGLGF